MKIGILDGNNEIDMERAVFGDEHEIICYNCRDENELPDDIETLEACMLWHYISLSEKTLLRLKSCSAIVRIGVGYDSVDIIKAGALGMPVFNVPDYGTNDVADHCIALFLAACRSLFIYNDSLKADIKHNWKPEIGGEIRRLTETSFGIVGFGRIGGAVAVRAKAFGLNVKFYDPYLPDGYDKTFQVERINSLGELFSECEYISIHTPLTPETKGMINANLFEQAKNNFILINTARGGIVCLDDVYNSLKSGKRKMFAADVLESEPPDEKYLLVNAFIQQDNRITDKVILSPHAAFYAEESRDEMRTKAAKTLSDCLNGIPARNCVNKEWLINPKVKVF